MSDTAFPYSEKLVADQLGLSRKNARALRELHLEDGIDWGTNDLGAIVLSERGVSVISKWVDKPIPNLELCLAAEKKNGAPQMIVVAVCMNPRMVLANESGDANAERFLVDVGNNKNMRIGDPMEVGPHDAQKDLLRCLSKLPRDDRRPVFYGSLREQHESALAAEKGDPQ